MVGPWVGGLGEQTVEEDWRPAKAGCMSTMVRLSSASAIDLIELISIREEADSLQLHLRQFTPKLELVRSQEMALDALEDKYARFVAPDAGIEALTYRQPEAEYLYVDVTLKGGMVVTAQLKRR